jgi:hypothetical protein
VAPFNRNLWTKTTVKAGEVITGIGYRFAHGQKIVRLERVVLADGKELRLYGRYMRVGRAAQARI